MRQTGAPAAASPDAYVRGLRGWRKDVVRALREAVTGGADFDETIKWGHLVYCSNGPAVLIRAEEERVLFGFWRGKRLTKIEPRLKPSGRFELANRVFCRGDVVDAVVAAQLAKQAALLNRRLGDPTKAARV